VPTPPETAPVQEGLAAASPWLALALLLVACAGVAGLWVLALRARGLERLAPRLDALEEIRAALARLSSQREDLDLRRIEHVLIELRDAQVRLEDVLMRHAEATRAALMNGEASTALPAIAGGGEALAERAINRLLAMGFERIQIVTRAEKLAELGARDGEVLVEARKGGVLHKGRVLVRTGRIANVELHPAYSIFP
jgi:hypothetical protein